MNIHNDHALWCEQRLLLEVERAFQPRGKLDTVETSNVKPRNCMVFRIVLGVLSHVIKSAGINRIWSFSKRGSDGFESQFEFDKDFDFGFQYLQVTLKVILLQPR